MRTVWKFELPVVDEFELMLPPGAEALTVQTQHGVPCLWVRLDPRAGRTERRRFRLAGTGHPIADNVERYVGTFQVREGTLVFHVFELA